MTMGCKGVVARLLLAFGLLLVGCNDQQQSSTTPVSAETHGRAECMPAPAFRLPDLSGRMHALKEYTGDQPVVLFFFTSWCPYCHKQIPTLKAIDRGRKALGVKLVTIGAGLEDTADNVRGYALENRLPYVVLYDEGAKVSARYGVKVVPAAFLVRQDGCMTQLGRHVSVAQLTQLR